MIPVAVMVEYGTGKTLYNYFLDNDPPSNPVEQKGSSWYIKMGFCGFNSPRNNREGYPSQHAALTAIRFYQRKRK